MTRQVQNKKGTFTIMWYRPSSLTGFAHITGPKITSADVFFTPWWVWRDCALTPSSLPELASLRSGFLSSYIFASCQPICWLACWEVEFSPSHTEHMVTFSKKQRQNSAQHHTDNLRIGGPFVQVLPSQRLMLVSWRDKCFSFFFFLFDVHVQYISVCVSLLFLCVVWTGNSLQGSTVHLFSHH